MRGRIYVLKDTLGEAIVTTRYRRDTNIVEIFDSNVASDISLTHPFLEAYTRKSSILDTTSDYFEEAYRDT
jgi:hypothetical protein